ncbi:MAG: PadR family transcriptional regulator [Thermotogota bacterium]|nr:PadR family transcriptional regulator [Thermotogota bacterium]
MPFFRRGFGPGKGRGIARIWRAAFILLLLAEKPSHGYELASRLEEFDLGSSSIGQMGGLYRILTELEAEELVVAEWNTSVPGPAKKEYRITSKGRTFLSRIADDFKNTKKILDRFIDRHDVINN